MKKYHYDLCRRRAQPATAVFVGTWIARTAGMHHLLRLSVLAPPHLPLETQNEVPVTAYIRFSRISRGRGSFDFFCLGRVAFVVPPHPSGWSCRIYPSTNKYIFGAKKGGHIENFSKYFSSRRSPRLILSWTEEGFVPSALAISALLMPIKKWA